MKRQKYDYVVGTGGIGKGILFQFTDNTTLGRNESRLADLTETRDFCKLHIILHYIAAYTEGSVPIYAVGQIGNDNSGREIKGLMEQYGIDCKYVSLNENFRTMYSVCFTYPDSDGGNITSRNSASGKMERSEVNRFFEQEKPAGKGIALAVPEVPLDVREEMLLRGREYGCFNVASFTSDEMQEAVGRRLFRYVDLLAVNQDEMRSLADVMSLDGKNREQECYDYLKRENPNMEFIVTRGGEGAQFFDKNGSERIPAIWRPVNSTAGAGDCFLATIISGLLYGVPLMEKDSKVGLGGLAALASSIKVTCKDTIDFSLNRIRLWEEAQKMGILFSGKVNRLFLERDRKI